MGHICIICAIRQEISPLLKRFPSKRVACFADLPVWHFQAFGHRVTLIQSGTGIANAAKTAAEAANLCPEIIINAGFCGALTTEVAVGEVLLAEKLYGYSSGLITSEITPDQELTAKVGTGFKRAIFITTADIVEKAHLYTLLPDRATTTMLEMESSAIAAVCLNRNIRFIALRSVSDTADHDPGWLFQQICDNKFNVRATKLALSLIKKPSLLSEYVQLYRNTAYAGKTLSKALASTLERI
jgi:adenosylhomocysteine nucleosidase